MTNATEVKDAITCTADFHTLTDGTTCQCTCDGRTPEQTGDFMKAHQQESARCACPVCDEPVSFQVCAMWPNSQKECPNCYSPISYSARNISNAR